MRINNNMAAMNSWRNLSVNGNNLNKSLERLSSGYRINKAADDAAGLAVSEKMRAQMRGLSMAVRNTQDGVSMVQTAEGGASKIQDMLQRMRELAVQSSSDTLQDTDRAQLHQEFSQLRLEIDRTSNTTEFNGISLLKGGGAGYGSSSSNTDVATITGNGSAASNLVVNVTQLATKAAITAGGSNTVINTGGTAGVYRISVDVDGGGPVDVDVNVGAGTSISAADVASAINANVTLNPDVTASVNTSGKLVITRNATGSANTVEVQESYDADITDNGAVFNGGTANHFFTGAQNGAVQAGTNLTYTTDNGTTVSAPITNASNTGVTIGTATVAFTNTGRTEIKTVDNSTTTSISVQAGPNATNNTISVDIDALNLTTLGISTANISSKTLITSTTPLSALDGAISKVSTARAKMGAQQNRLENAISTLQVQSENLTSAESRIRDVDMAAEMAQFTKFQVLQNASMSMLGQANQLSQGIMSLLRG